jgi:hypothetical protein
VRGNPRHLADLDQGLARRRQRQRDTDGEHGCSQRQSRPEQPGPPVLRLAPRLPVFVAPALPGVPAPSQAGQEAAGRPCPGMFVRPSRAGLDPRADPLETIRVRLHLVRGSV